MHPALTPGTPGEKQTFRWGLCPPTPARGANVGLSVSPSGTSCHLPCRGDTSGLSAPATAGCSAGCRQKRARCAHSSDNPVTRWTQSASILCADSAAFARATAAVKTDMDCFFDSLYPPLTVRGGFFCLYFSIEICGKMWYNIIMFPAAAGLH